MGVNANKPSGNAMNSAEKLDKIIQAIIKTKDKSWSMTDLKNPSLFKLDISTSNGLAFIGRDEALKILENLQRSEKVIKLFERNYPSKITHKTIIRHYDIDEKTGKKTYIPIKNPTPIKTPQPDLDAIYLNLEPGFDNWLDHYTTQKNRKLEDMDSSEILYMYGLVLLIDQKLKLSSSPRVNILNIPNISKYSKRF